MTLTMTAFSNSSEFSSDYYESLPQLVTTTAWTTSCSLFDVAYKPYVNFYIYFNHYTLGLFSHLLIDEDMSIYSSKSFCTSGIPTQTLLLNAFHVLNCSLLIWALFYAFILSPIIKICQDETSTYKPDWSYLDVSNENVHNVFLFYRRFSLATYSTFFYNVIVFWLIWKLFIVQAYPEVLRVHILLIFLFDALLLYLSFSIFLHRYLSHHVFFIPHTWQRWIFNAYALIGGSASFLGSPYWWVATHKHHHANCDQVGVDKHSPFYLNENYPKWFRLLWSHSLWICNPFSFTTRVGRYYHIPKSFRKLWPFHETWFRILVDHVWYIIPNSAFKLLCLHFGDGYGYMHGFAICLSSHLAFCISSATHSFEHHPQGRQCKARDNPKFPVMLGDQNHGFHHDHPCHYLQEEADANISVWNIDLVGRFIGYCVRHFGWVTNVPQPVPAANNN